MDKKLKKVIDLALDIPRHKLLIVSCHKDLLAGAYGYLAHYGYELNPDLADVFIREVEIKLADTEEVEFEWSEDQWEALEYIKTLGSQVVQGKYKQEIKFVYGKYEPKS